MNEVKPRKVELYDVSPECQLLVYGCRDTCLPSHQVAPEQVRAGCHVQRLNSRVALECLCIHMNHSGYRSLFM